MAYPERLKQTLQAHAAWVASKGREGARADFQGADLRSADLQGVNLQAANLEGADLRGADLSRANLAAAELLEANLEGADLSGANLQGVNLEHTEGLTQAQIDRAVLDATTQLPASLHLPKSPPSVPIRFEGP